MPDTFGDAIENDLLKDPGLGIHVEQLGFTAQIATTSPGQRYTQSPLAMTMIILPTADQAPGIVDPSWPQGLAFGVLDEAGTSGAFFWSGYFNTTTFGHPGKGTVVVLLKQTYATREDPTSGAAQAMMAS